MRILTVSSGLGLILHDISLRSQIFNAESAHKGKITGVTFADGDRLLSCGVDRNVKLWDTRQHPTDENGAGPSEVRLRSICPEIHVEIFTESEAFEHISGKNSIQVGLLKTIL